MFDITSWKPSSICESSLKTKYISNYLYSPQSIIALAKKDERKHWTVECMKQRVRLWFALMLPLRYTCDGCEAGEDRTAKVNWLRQIHLLRKHGHFLLHAIFTFSFCMYVWLKIFVCFLCLSLSLSSFIFLLTIPNCLNQDTYFTSFVCISAQFMYFSMYMSTCLSFWLTTHHFDYVSIISIISCPLLLCLLALFIFILFVSSFVCSFIQSFIHSFTYLFIYSFIYLLFIYLFCGYTYSRPMYPLSKPQIKSWFVNSRQITWDFKSITSMTRKSLAMPDVHI